MNSVIPNSLGHDPNQTHRSSLHISYADNDVIPKRKTNYCQTKYVTVKLFQKRVVRRIQLDIDTFSKKVLLRNYHILKQLCCDVSKCSLKCYKMNLISLWNSLKRNNNK